MTARPGKWRAKGGSADSGAVTPDLFSQTTDAQPGPQLPPSTVILASAGSGKTFQLTSRYIRLLLAGVDASRILASTFTRLAAGQIFERVLSRLVEASRGDREAGELAAHLELGSLSPSAVQGALVRFLSDVGRIQIGTLDSFLNRLAGVYAPTIGLPPGWRIVEDDEDERLRARAIEAALAGADRDQTLAFLRLLGGKRFYSAAISGAMKFAVDNAYSTFLNTTGEAWHSLSIPAAGQLSRAQMDEISSRWDTLPLAITSSGAVHAQWKTAHEKARAAFDAGDWVGVVGTGLCSAVAEGAPTYSRFPIAPDVVDFYRPIIAHAKATLLRTHAERGHAMHGLLSGFDAAYRSLKREQSAYRFDDIPRLLLSQGEALTLEDIAFRLDARLDHILLDEFQDTSVAQFSLLSPLLEEILSGGGGLGENPRARSVLCVGDAKQSLYQWRDAEPALLGALANRWPQLKATPLDRSYRSSSVVLDAVNSVFQGLENNAALARAREGARLWSRSFHQHDGAKKDLPGLVQLIVAPTPDPHIPIARASISHACTLVRSIVAAQPAASVGVLVRARKHIPRLIFELGRMGIDASEEGGNPLTDSLAVAAALSALELADHPGDTAAAFHVATSPLGAVLSFTDWTSESTRRGVASSVRERLAEAGYANLLHEWLDALTPSMDARDVRRFEQLIELAGLYDARLDPRAEHFIDMVRTRRVEDPTRHPVRVMTVHTSKGLEFDAVILPNLDSRLLMANSSLLVHRPGPFDPIDVVTPHANAEVRAIAPQLQELHRQQEARQTYEELCILYVAMTRARHALHMVIAPPKPRSTNKSTPSLPLTHAGILRAALAPDRPLVPGVLFSSGDEKWHTHLNAGGPPAATRSISISLAKDADEHRFTASKPSAGEERLRRWSDRETMATRSRGTLLHAWFEQIDWLDDARVPSIEELLRIAASLSIPLPTVDVRREADRFLKSLREPSIRSVLARSRYTSAMPPDGSLRVRRELPFALTLHGASEAGHRGLVTGRIDRLVLCLDHEGKPHSAEVLDFKSDSLARTTPEEVRESYRHQLESYREAASRFTGLPASRISCALVLLAGPIVLSVDPASPATGGRPRSGA